MSHLKLVWLWTLLWLLWTGCTSRGSDSVGRASQLPSVAVAGAAAVPNVHAQSPAPSDQDILRAGRLSLPLVPVGATQADENRELRAALAAYDAGVLAHGNRDAVEPLLRFLAARPQSAWRAALSINLGSIYRQTGHFSLALETWQTAWALTKQLRDANGSALGDAAVAQLSQLLAYMGRARELEALLDEVIGRPLRGSAAELVSESARGLANMQLTPESSFKCGPFALASILEAQPSPAPREQLEVLHAARSTARGIALPAVQALSERAGMHFQMAFRPRAAAIVVPAVAHFRVGHYAAVVEHDAGRVRVRDATFGEDVRMSATTLDEEASGYFLIGPGPLPPGWRAVSKAEGASVWGRGDTGSNKDNGATGPADASAYPADGGSCAGGCTTWNVEAMVVGLSLHDTPLGYAPAVGPAVRFELHYSQRDVQQPQVFNYANLGRKWTSSWLSYVTDNSDVNGTVELYRRGGGNETFSFMSGANTSKPGPFSQTTITRRNDTSGRAVSFRREFADGSAEEFGAALGAKYFMTEVFDTQGKSVKLTYDEQFRITKLTDAAGQVTTLAYEIAGDPLKLSQVTDPFGRSARFKYTADGNLASITDTLDITSKFTYAVGDFIEALETPYGTTHFAYADSTTDKALGSSRSLTITDALGRTSRVEFRHAAPGISSVEPVVKVPTGLTLRNELLEFRNTFVWNAAQLAQAQASGGLDYTKARIIHWLHTADNSTARVVESVKEPLENRIWFDYPGQTQPINVGTSDRPLHIGRVLDDGTTQLRSFEYGERGQLIQTTDPVGRKLRYEYAANRVDLVSVSNTTGTVNERLFSATYNDNHQPLTIGTGTGSSSHYEYDAAGRLLAMTDALGNAKHFSYDAQGRLTAVEGPTPAVRYVLERDAVGRIASVADAAGRAVRYTYDAADRRTSVKYPDGTSQEYTYQLLDLARVTDRAGRATKLTFDAERQLAEVADPLGQTLRIGYGLDGQVTSVTDPNGGVTALSRDLQGRLLSKQYADGSMQRFGYEAATSRLRTQTDALNQSTVYDYAADDSLVKIDHADATQPTAAVTFEYDSAYQRVVKMVDGIGETLYNYHPLSSPIAGAGRLASITSPVAGGKGATDTVAYRYDALDRVIGREVNSSQETTEYDALGRPSALRNLLDSFLFGYDSASGRMSSVESAKGPHSALSYYAAPSDALLRQLDVTKSSGQPLAQFGYAYDETANVRAFAESYAGRQLPTFDEVASKGALLPGRRAGGPEEPPSDGSARVDGRAFMRPALLVVCVALIALLLLAYWRRVSPALVAWLVPLLLTSFCTDANLNAGSGESKLTVYSYDLAQRLISALVKQGTGAGTSDRPTFEYAYDANSNLTSLRSLADSQALQYTATNALGTGRYDANGNPRELGDGRYGWDAAGRVITISQGRHSSEFTYDGLSRMVRVVDKQDDRVTADHAYLWCGAVRCLERDNLRAGSPISKRYFAQGFVSGDEHIYYVTDRLGSVRQLVDATGRVRAQYDYDPYGKSVKKRGDLDSDVRYAGYFHHAASGLEFTMRRAYDPTRGRWLSRDPLAEGGGAVNLYAYVHGNPLSFIDASGLRPVTADEQEFLYQYFGDSLDTSVMDIGSSLGSRSWSPYGNRVSLTSSNFVGGDADKAVNLSDPDAASTLAHEALHVWQRQHGRWVTTEGACLQIPYSLGGSSPYTYKATTNPKTMLKQFQTGNVEQQGQIFEDYVYRDRTGGNTAPYHAVAEEVLQMSIP